MPTSFPRLFPEVRFPYDFTQQYKGSFGYTPSFMDYAAEQAVGGARRTYMEDMDTHVKPSRKVGFELVDIATHVKPMKMSTGILGGWPPEDGLASERDLVHKGRRTEALQMVRAAVKSREKSRINMITNNVGIGNRLEGGCADCDGGAVGSGFRDEGAQVLAGKGRRLHGGVMRTLAGRQHVAGRLTARINEFNSRNVETFDSPWPEQQQPRFSETGDVMVELGEHLTALSDAMTSSVWDKDTTKEARGFLATLVKSGWAIPQNQITLILRQTIGVLSAMEQLAGSPPGANDDIRKDRRIMRLVFVIMERARLLLEGLSKNSMLSPEERRMYLAAQAQQLARTTEAQRLARAPNRTGYSLEMKPEMGDVPRFLFPVQGVPASWRPKQAGIRLPADYSAEELGLFE